MNGIAIQTIALCDTGAKASLIVSPEIAKRAKRDLQARIEPLPSPIQLSDYKQQPSGKVTHQLVADFELDGRRFLQQTFWITETKSDIFIGLDWLAKQDVLLRPKTRSLIWPDSLPPLALFSRALVQSPSLSQGTESQQKSSNLRDKIVEKQLVKYEILRRTRTDRLEDKQDQATVAQINATQQDPRWEQWNKQPLPTKMIPIQAINFQKTYPEQQNIPFPKHEDPDHVQNVRSRLPKHLAHLEGFFSKIEANSLAEPRPGHDVVLELTGPTIGSRHPTVRPSNISPLRKKP